MADSPKGSSGDFAKKVQRQLSRGKEKVLQKLGKTVETKDDQFEHCFRQFSDQQTDGNRIYKDLRNYINAVRDMREASRRLSQSLFDAYEADWEGGEDLGTVVEGGDLLWNDFEVKLVDQAVHTMESYVSQFPDVREKISKRGRKLVDYDSSRHHLEALQAAKKRDDIKIRKAEEEMNASKAIYEGINSDLKEELPALYESRIGCYISVFSSVSNLQTTFFKEMLKLNIDLQNVIKELQAQHPDKVFAVRGMQRYGSLKRRILMSPKAWKASFSEFHWSYSPKSSQRFSVRSPDKPRHSTLSRETSSISGASHPSILEGPTSGSRDLDAGASHNEVPSLSAKTETAQETAGKGPEDDSNQAEKEKKEEEAEPPAESDNKADEEAAPSESSCELNNSCDSESLELQLSSVTDNGPLHIDESDDSPEEPNSPKENGPQDDKVPNKDASTENQTSPDTKSTIV